MPQRAVLNDVNPHVIHFYQKLKHGLQIEIPMRNSESLYYRHRTRFNALLAKGKTGEDEAAALFYYLNRTGYNGLCRFNRKGMFNVPFGRYVKINYTRDFSPYREVFSRWDFLSEDFQRIPLPDEDFIYADPPYDVEFTDYARDGFTWKDQVRAAEWLARHKGPVVLTNQATRRIIDLYETLGYELRYLKAPRMISCTGDRAPATEVMAIRNL
jgi:DNA adenine methylase